MKRKWKENNKANLSTTHLIPEPSLKQKRQLHWYHLSAREYSQCFEKSGKINWNKCNQLKENLEKKLKKNSNDIITNYFKLAELLELCYRNIKKAIKIYEIILDLKPNHFDAHFNLAVIYDVKLKNYDKAKFHYETLCRVILIF